MRSSLLLGLLLIGATTLAHPSGGVAQPCAGDCGGDGAVTVDEVVTGVNIVLGSTPVSACAVLDRDGDATVDISDVLASVTNLLSGCPEADPRIVQTDNGLLRGLATNRVRSFLGIPYAAPPVGELRWRAPQPYPHWSGVRDATTAGSVCAQTIPFLNSQAGSEDCLFLNVHAPTPAPTSPLPVMVWIHGGAFTSGDGLQFGGTDGSDIVRRAGVVVVSLNYRLGELGFLAHPQLSRGYSGDAAGNFGLQDQIAALKWVQRNIAAFGGDPHNVTIFGESAGGWSVCLHLVSPLSSGLFQRAIVQSGLCTTPLSSLGAAEQQGLRLATKIGCGDSYAQLDCMRSKSADEVRSALPPDPLFAFSEGEFGSWSPIVDGTVITAQPADSLASGNFNRVPLLIGSNRDEGTLFVALSHDLAGRPLTAERYPERLAYLLDSRLVGAVEQHYPLSNFAKPGAALAAAFGDGFLACPTIKAAALAAPFVPTYLYQFEYPDAPFTFPVDVPLGAFHSAEIQYVFGRRIGAGFNATERALSQQVMGYWTRFAAAGDPNGGDATTWPLHGESANYVALDRQITSGQQPKAADCQFWNNLGYQRAPLVDPWAQRRAELENQRAKWLSNGIDSYQMRYQRFCFCRDPSEVDVLVRNGQLVSVRDVATGDVLTPLPGPTGYNTIDQVFDIVANAIERRADGFSVAYDADLGFPSAIELDYVREIADDEVTIRVTDLQRQRQAN